MEQSVTHIVSSPASKEAAHSKLKIEEPPSRTCKNFFARIWAQLCGTAPHKGSIENLFSDASNDREDVIVARTLHFKSLRSEDVGIPRADIIAVPIDTDYQHLVQAFSQCTFSRLPVYRENLDNIVGMVHIKDIIKYALEPNKFALEQIVREVLFISPALSLRDLLMEMQATRVHVALVVDEFGGIDSLITLENVIEEIVGDIHDVDEALPTPKIMSLGDNLYLSDARVTLEEFEEKTGVQLHLTNNTEYVDTLGGYVTALIDHIPIRGELVRSPSGVEFEVIEADPRRLKKLKIRFLKETEPGQHAAQEAAYK